MNTIPATRLSASLIIREALARHGSHSQCDLLHLLGQLDYKTMTLGALVIAADKAASDLLDV